MGYYSEVAFMLDSELHNDFLAAIDKLEDPLRGNVRELLGMFTKRRYQGGFVLYHTQLIKWYITEFPDVKFVDDWLNDQDYHRYQYITIGEEFDDVGEVGFMSDAPDNMYVERRIVVPKGGRKCS